MKKLVVIGGPTCSGKTDYAFQLAKELKTEIISADARQFYRGMEIGTAQPEQEMLKKINHHFIGHLEVTETYTAGMFERDVLKLLDELFLKYPVVIMVGGSGLFIQAVCEGLDDIPSDHIIREQLNQIPLEELQEELKRKDPLFYEEVDLKNPRRVQRALEVIRITGQPYSQFRLKKKKIRPFAIEACRLSPDKKVLEQRIRERVDRMMQQGLLGEVEKLLPWRNCNALKTVGYSELFSYLDNEIRLEEAVEQIKIHTRQYAKRQETWFAAKDMHVITAGY